MKYLSTRGGDERLSFEQAVLRGLAPNGGLYIPTQIPQLPSDWQTKWASMSFSELSFQVLSLYIPSDPSQGGIPSDDLRELINRSYSTFRHADTTPLVRLDEKEWCLELWHGPTFAFKDVALQLLGNFFEYFLQRRNKGKSGNDREKLTIVGATSGDTGSAAIQGVRSKEDISIFILHPKGRVSPIQEAQMTTVLDDNVHNVAVEGTFDDCQDIVKALFSDAEFNAKHRLGAVNSINWARILAQIVYYFSAYFQFRRQLGLVPTNAAPADLEFVVPTGNFGDILAGYYAKRMGLPIAKLVVATNENDILQRFWASGKYEKSSGAAAAAVAQTEPVQGSSDGAQQQQSDGGVKATLSPAMDILVSSNFERLLWYVAYESQREGEADREAAAGRQLAGWMQSLKKQGRLVVDEAQLAIARRDFDAERVSDDEIQQTVLEYFERAGNAVYAKGSYLVDPHSAVGFKAAANVVAKRPGGASARPHQIVLSTAHPAKFAEAVTSSLASAGARFDFERDVLPKEMVGLLEKERRVVEVKANQGGRTGLDALIHSTKEVIEKQRDVVNAKAAQLNTASV